MKSRVSNRYVEDSRCNDSDNSPESHELANQISAEETRQSRRATSSEISFQLAKGSGMAFLPTRGSKDIAMESSISLWVMKLARSWPKLARPHLAKFEFGQTNRNWPECGSWPEFGIPEMDFDSIWPEFVF